MEQYKKVGNLKVRTDLSPEKQALVNQIAQNYVNQNKKIDAEARKGYLRGGFGSVVSGLSFHPIMNIPYVGTGVGGAMYDLGQGIVAGDKAKDLAKRAARGFAIGETVGAIPYVGKAAAKTKAGQTIGKQLNKTVEKVAQNPAVQKAYDTMMSEFAPVKAIEKNVVLPAVRKVNAGINPLAKAYNNVLYDTRSFNPEIEDIARNYFGTTTNRRETGYILNDGSFLDMSGKNFGGTPGRRSLDHREITDAFLDNPANKNNLEVGFDEFIDNGAIRYMPETNSFFMSREPSESQINAIKNLLDYERGKSSIELVPNVSEWGLDNNFRRDYKLWSDPKKIIEDIRTYYKGGKPSDLRDYI